MKFEDFDVELKDIDPRFFEVESFQKEITETVSSLSASDWKNITNNWRSKPEQWQLNFILAAEYVCKEAENIIVQMLQSTHKEVVLSAISSLFDAGFGKWIPNEQEVMTLKNLLAVADYCAHMEEELNGLIARSKEL